MLKPCSFVFHQHLSLLFLSVVNSCVVILNNFHDLATNNRNRLCVSNRCHRKLTSIQWKHLVRSFVIFRFLFVLRLLLLLLFLFYQIMFSFILPIAYKTIYFLSFSLGGVRYTVCVYSTLFFAMVSEMANRCAHRVFAPQ